MPETQTLSLPTVPFAGAPPAEGSHCLPRRLWTPAVPSSGQTLRTPRGGATRLSLLAAAALFALGAIALFLLAACQASWTPPRQFVAEWQEARLLFLADGGSARVRVFSLAALAPVPLGELHSQAGRGVSDLALDTQRGQLWVLGSEQLELFDARRRQLLARWRLPAAAAGADASAATVAALRIDGSGVLLLAADGRHLGHCTGESGVLRLNAAAGGALP